ncbi:tripartite motif-containing protein 10-like isoform X2 [Paroedura picta]|uniref:tripartite motif-containing protein 10-like isoform X2 n=1 Tax=Paroedura picta TaxID=143630 RepID=UPI0040573708
MASRSATTEMGQESKCSICLQHLIHSRTLDCGHSFCQGCITLYGEAWGTMRDSGCPVCKFKSQKGNFGQNWPEANPGEKMNLQPRSSRNEGICLRHKGKLHLFCREDEKLVCFVCGRFPEHEGHALLLLEEASPQYKGRFHGCLEILRKEKGEILAYKADVEKESQDLLNVTKSERQKARAEFRKLHQFLEEQEEVLLTETEETEKEIARKRDGHLARLSAELSLLESLIQEVEEKIQQPGRELLQDVRNTLQRYERKKFENLAAFPSELKWRIWGFCNIPPLLEGVAKKCKASLVSGLHLQKAKVTLDPASNSCCLVHLSEGQKKVMRKSTAQDLSKDPEKHYGFVLGREGFTAGCHFWEVVCMGMAAWGSFPETVKSP